MINFPIPSEILVRYVFLDIVGFTTRNIEEQFQLVQTLNTIVSKTTSIVLTNTNYRFIPLGDGICICLYDPLTMYDTTITLALSLLEAIENHNNESIPEEQFTIRIGLNHNYDNLVLDINQQTNVCGTGINYAQRIMSLGDGNQILISQSTWDTLKDRKKYTNDFRHFRGSVKHDILIDVFQYVKPNTPGLNTSIPSYFRVENPEEIKLSKVEAYYIKHAIMNELFIERTLENNHPQIYSLELVLFYKAMDSAFNSEHDRFEQHVRLPIGTIQEQLEIIHKCPFAIIADFSRHLRSRIIQHPSYFTDPSEPMFVNDIGKRFIKEQWPDIWENDPLNITQSFPQKLPLVKPSDFTI
jgi:class 3 adenylate cyclase